MERTRYVWGGAGLRRLQDSAPEEGLLVSIFPPEAEWVSKAVRRDTGGGEKVCPLGTGGSSPEPEMKNC